MTPPATWSTWTSRNSAASPMAVAGANLAAETTRPRVTPASATPTCTTLSMTAHAWRIRQILGDEKKDTVAGFWNRARDFFTGYGMDISRVITVNCQASGW